VNPQLLIRTAVLADRAAIWGILEPVIRAGETYALPADMSEADAIAYWTGPGREVFVAEWDGRVVGTYFLCANQKGGGDHVANAAYATLPAMRGRGIARGMVGHSLVEAARRGFSAMQFNFVVSSNKDAVHLWQSLGFEVVGRLPGAFRHPQLGPVDALVMCRRL
jgi:GNAT superfamily N-acetyltransferase